MLLLGTRSNAADKMQFIVQYVATSQSDFINTPARAVFLVNSACWRVLLVDMRPLV